jgi:hypothetical protein
MPSSPEIEAVVDALKRRGRPENNDHWPDGNPDYVTEYSLTQEGLRRQSELCQQAVIADFQFSVSQNPTDGDLCRGGGNAMCPCISFRITIH